MDRLKLLFLVVFLFNSYQLIESISICKNDIAFSLFDFSGNIHNKIIQNQHDRIIINDELSFICPAGWKVANESILKKYKEFTKQRIGVQSSLKIVLMKLDDYDINYPQITIGIVPYGKVSEPVTFDILKESVKDQMQKTLNIIIKEVFCEFISDIKTEELLINEKNEWLLIKNTIEIPLEGGELINYMTWVNCKEGVCRINLSCLPSQLKESFSALKIILNTLERTKI